MLGCTEVVVKEYREVVKAINDGHTQYTAPVSSVLVVAGQLRDISEQLVSISNQLERIHRALDLRDV